MDGNERVRFNRTRIFSTPQNDNEPDKFDANNIEYSYPIANQYHFLKSEADYGFLKLKYSPLSLPKLEDPNYSLRMRLSDLTSPIDSSVLKI